jgi:hypothetical protein
LGEHLPNFLSQIPSTPKEKKKRKKKSPKFEGKPSLQENFYRILTKFSIWGRFLLVWTIFYKCVINLMLCLFWDD